MFQSRLGGEVFAAGLYDIFQIRSVIALSLGNFLNAVDEGLVADIVLRENPHAAIIDARTRSASSSMLHLRLPTGDECPVVVSFRLRAVRPDTVEAPGSDNPIRSEGEPGDDREVAWADLELGLGRPILADAANATEALDVNITVIDRAISVVDVSVVVDLDMLRVLWSNVNTQSGLRPSGVVAATRC